MELHFSGGAFDGWGGPLAHPFHTAARSAWHDLQRRHYCTARWRRGTPPVSGLSSVLRFCDGESRRRSPKASTGRSRRGDKDVDESARRTERSCHSCAADAVADTIAVCCCPCAVVSQLFLAVLKVPSALGSRCLQIARRRGGASKKDGGGKNGESGTISVGESREKKADLRVESLVEISSAWNEAEEERAWKEMYLAGHWGFGRVSVSVSISEEKN
ncbi:hypothetical protein HPP92_008039 [Vanilla planifolia]|uniref:Uncharacterized protein n=1 Tax=Vanilla planifolia TaxID=51239 RepID=A0A835RN60_VANPL|nr:hypothetical protein HPP92_008039 [Vanilla planifolia]